MARSGCSWVAGCDGVQVNFFDYEPDLEHFASRVLPLMRQAGLRK